MDKKKYSTCKSADLFSKKNYAKPHLIAAPAGDLNVMHCQTKYGVMLSRHSPRDPSLLLKVNNFY